ncbi:MAG: hypothetical protein HC888_13020 [Candidatus Competibacteraceae bacterium]|nr:hypothetical protein [Candidatus Competibacteraceae bacterium]
MALAHVPGFLDYGVGLCGSRERENLVSFFIFFGIDYLCLEPVLQKRSGYKFDISSFSKQLYAHQVGEAQF